jgi:hypothetical protein
VESYFYFYVLTIFLISLLVTITSGMSIMQLEVKLTSEMEVILAAIHCTDIKSYLEKKCSKNMKYLLLIFFFAECKISLQLCSS